MIRNCVDKPVYTDKVVEDQKLRTYYKACRQDLCNSGNGHGDISNKVIGSLGDKSTIYCPGIGTSDGAPKASVTLAIAFVLAVSTYMLV